MKQSRKKDTAAKLINGVHNEFKQDLTRHPLLAIPNDCVLADRFRIEEHVSVGMLGDTYRAFDEETSRTVLLLIADIGIEGEPTDCPMMDAYQENRSITDSRYVVRFHEVRDTRYGGTRLRILPCEYPGNTKLDQLLSVDRHSSFQSSMLLFLRICDGIQAIHNANLLHLHLTPGAISISSDEPKVWTVLQFPSIHADSNQYVAPEVLNQDGPADARADIYSLGVILSKLLEQHQVTESTTPSLHLSESTKLLFGIVRKCTHIGAACRFQSIADLRQAIISGYPALAIVSGENSVEEIWEQACGEYGKNNLSAARDCCQFLNEHAPDFQPAYDLKRKIDERYEGANKHYDSLERRLQQRVIGELIGSLSEAM